MNKYKKLQETYKENLLKAIKHLQYSYEKLQNNKIVPTANDEEVLETWESFTARFARVVDIFLTKYIRAFILNIDPGFEGSLRDFVNQAEKLMLIDNARSWMAFREYRNTTAHEYQGEDLEHFFEAVFKAAPTVIAIKEKL